VRLTPFFSCCTHFQPIFCNVAIQSMSSASAAAAAAAPKKTQPSGAAVIAYCSFMKLFVNLLAGRVISLDVAPGDRVAKVKALICDVEGIGAALQRLIFAGQLLDDNQTLQECGVGPGSTVHLAVVSGQAHAASGLSAAGDIPSLLIRVRQDAATMNVLRHSLEDRDTVAIPARRVYQYASIVKTLYAGCRC
jgi:hypothetical protein